MEGLRVEFAHQPAPPIPGVSTHKVAPPPPPPHYPGFGHYRGRGRGTPGRTSSHPGELLLDTVDYEKSILHLLYGNNKPKVLKRVFHWKLWDNENSFPVFLAQEKFTYKRENTGYLECLCEVPGSCFVRTRSLT